MAESPLPQGTRLPDGSHLGRVVTSQTGAFWIHALKDGRRALVLTEEVFVELSTRLSSVAPLDTLTFGNTNYRVMVSRGELDVLNRLQRPTTVKDALPFATALADLDHDYTEAIYSRDLAMLLPFHFLGQPKLEKDLVLGRYLSGGIDVRASDVIALERIVTKIEPEDLEYIVATAGIEIKSVSKRPAKRQSPPHAAGEGRSKPTGPFYLPGRRELSDFFNEHIVDVISAEERYAALGIGFPGSVILEGPTGCGKTYAVEKLIEHLGWQSFSIDASSIASPYIHETSRKVAEVFAAAKKAAPSVIVIDEMDAFLTERSSGTDQHRLEEVAEFLRRIPEASANRVLVIGMTNKIDLIDPAILRRGRFDYVIHVDHAGSAEVESLLSKLLEGIPHDLQDLGPLAVSLAGRPLSDAAFVVREAGRMAARAARDSISEVDIQRALARCASREPNDRQRMGF